MIRILHGDARDVLRSLPDASVHMVCTSPPYFGLRQYLPDGHPDMSKQIGLEASPADYVAAMVEVFREVWRVLRADGTCWVVLGDSYAEKNLIGIPWRVAFALQADGWWLRSDIVWAKRNCMPESVSGSHFVRHMITISEYERFEHECVGGLPEMQFEEGQQDNASGLVACPGCSKCGPSGGYILRMSAGRPTKAHEYLFLLAKSERYFYDAVAIEEDGEIAAGTRAAKGSAERAKHANGRPPEYAVYTGKRNKRSVWWIATQPLAIAHFATFPPDLIEPCIRAGTSERGCCPACGAPWVRVVERMGVDMAARYARGEPVRHGANGAAASGASNVGGYSGETRTTGWLPSCACLDAPPVPATVLDPFGGAGTTGLVADRLGRNAILIELNADYVRMAERRVTGDAPLFAEVSA